MLNKRKRSAAVKQFEGLAGTTAKGRGGGKARGKRKQQQSKRRARASAQAKIKAVMKDRKKR